jgi:hypothetical protein
MNHMTDFQWYRLRYILWVRMVEQMRPSLFAGLGVALLLNSGARAQEPPTSTPAGEQARQNPASPCMEPPPLVRWEDYEGPFAKLVGTFGRKLERKAVHLPRYKPGAMLCSLEPGDKFLLFLQDTIDPVSVLAPSFDAALDHAANRDPSFGQGGLGYAKRFGADFAGQTASRFFGDFLYPAIFSEDPRYYRQGHGRAGSRLLHAMRHTVVAHRDDGTLMFNFTEWLGTASSVALNNLYHPGNQPGVAAAARNGAYSVLQDMGLDVLREFWPEIARKFKMPFRGLRKEPPPGRNGGSGTT